MKRRQFLALGAAAAVAPVLPPLAEAEALTEESLLRTLVSVPPRALMATPRYAIMALTPGLQRVQLSAAMDYTAWGAIVGTCVSTSGE
jgi:hypothetical protein